MENGQLNRVLVIGVGNEYRGDDGVGRYVARRIAEFALPGVEVREESGEGAALIDAWQGYEYVILIDATSSDSPPGTLRRLDARDGPMPTEFFHYSTHAFSLAEAVELARVLGCIPPSLIIYGIEGGSFSAGTTLSEEVRLTADEVVRKIQVEVQDSNRAAQASGTAGS